MSKKLTFKIWVLIIFLLFSLISIFGIPPSFLQKGVLITSVDHNSTAFELGLRKGNIIIGIDEKKINSLEDFLEIINSKYPSDKDIKTIIQTKNSEIILYSKEAPEIIVSKIPKTNIKLGLDLAGGARALVKAQNKSLDSKEINTLIDITSNRFNVYGLSDVKVSPVSDLSGEHFMLIEIAGATPTDLKKLISEQGKFEAKIGNETVFIGGDRDVASVCRNDATCAVITACNPDGAGSFYCKFRFSVYLSEAAAKRHANITSELEVNETSECLSNKESCSLEKPLDLYVDDKLVSSLLINEGLKGSDTTQISISGSGKGETEQDAYTNTQQEMHNLQTILITGSLPYKLNIEKLDTISPTLGKEFIHSIFLAVIIALIAVTIIIFIRYKNFKSSVTLLVISISEIIIILGIASLIKWNLDLPSIAGILATIGTGLDDLIIILDETTQKFLSLKQRLKRAFVIILGAYFTSFVSLLPLMWAGAGLLKGFAVTTIIGITVGVFITRPAFGDIIKNFIKE